MSVQREDYSRQPENASQNPPAAEGRLPQRTGARFPVENLASRPVRPDPMGWGLRNARPPGDSRGIWAVPVMAKITAIIYGSRQPPKAYSQNTKNRSRRKNNIVLQNHRRKNTAKQIKPTTALPGPSNNHGRMGEPAIFLFIPALFIPVFPAFVTRQEWYGVDCRHGGCFHGGRRVNTPPYFAVSGSTEGVTAMFQTARVTAAIKATAVHTKRTACRLNLPAISRYRPNWCCPQNVPDEYCTLEASASCRVSTRRTLLRQRSPRERQVQIAPHCLPSLAIFSGFCPSSFVLVRKDFVHVQFTKLTKVFYHRPPD